MSITDWSVRPADNGWVDPALPVTDGASARRYPGFLRELMSRIAAQALDQGGALSSEGAQNAYTVRSHSGFSVLKAGVQVSVIFDRDNTDAATLNLDGLGPIPLCDVDGAPLPAGQIKAGRMSRCVFDEARRVWLLDVLTSAATIDFVNSLWARLGLYVGDFGPLYLGKDAIPAQIASNTATCNAAIRAAIVRGVSKLTFPFGDLVVGRSGLYKNFALHIDGARNLLLIGQGTRLWMSGSSLADYCGAFAWTNCTGVCDLAGEWEIDQLHPACISGTVTAVAATTIDVTFDWAPTWNQVRQVVRRADDEEGWSAITLFCHVQDKPRTLTQVAGLTYRIDTSNNPSLPAFINNPALSPVGVRVAVGHNRYGCDVLEATNCEKVRLLEGVVIRGGAGAAIYGVASGIEWRDARVEARMRNGRRDYTSVSADGCHFLGCGADFYFRGSISDTMDDTLNMIAVDLPVLGRVNARTLTLGAPEEASTIVRVNQSIDLLDETKYPQGTFRVLAIQGSAGAQVITVDRDLPGGINQNGAWKASVRSTSINYRVEDGSRFERSGAVGIRFSAARCYIGDVLVRSTLYEGIQSGSFTGTEYSPFDILTIGAPILQRTCQCIDPSRAALGGGIAALAIRPRLDDDATIVQKGSVGRIVIGAMKVIDCGSMPLYIAGARKVLASDLRAVDFATTAQPIDGQVAYAFAQFVSCDEVELLDCSAFGASPAALNLINNGRVKVRAPEGFYVPTGGATTLDADMGWTQFVPSIGSEVGAVGPSPTVSGEYMISRRLVSFTVSASGLNGTADKGFRVFLPSFLVPRAASFVATGRDKKTGKELQVPVRGAYLNVLNDEGQHPVGADGTFSFDISGEFGI